MRYVALVSFRNLEKPGRVIWKHRLSAPQDLFGLGGFGEMRPGDVFNSYRFAESERGYRSFIASPTGEDPVLLDVEAEGENAFFEIDGPYMVFLSDWTYGSMTTALGVPRVSRHSLCFSLFPTSMAHVWCTIHRNALGVKA